MSDAKEFLDMESKTQIAYDKAYSKLTAAISLLEEKPDKSLLANIITQAEEYEVNTIVTP